MKFVCPFYSSYNSKTKILNCSGHKLKFKERIDRLEYTGRYCCCEEGWHNCTIAQEHIKQAARKDDDHDGEDQEYYKGSTQKNTQRAKTGRYRKIDCIG